MNTLPPRLPQNPLEMRLGISPQQKEAVETLEHFGWTLRFVRKPLFRDAIPVLFDRSGDRYVILRSDGTLDESMTLPLRG